MGKMNSILPIIMWILTVSCSLKDKNQQNSGPARRSPPQCMISSGHRGLVFTIDTLTPQSQANIPMILGCIGNIGYSNEVYFNTNSNNNSIILRDELTRREFDSIGARFFSSRSTRRLFSLAEDCAMANGDLFAIEHGRLRIYPGKAQTEAHRRYNLTEKQTCLGAFDDRVYFWVEGKPTELYFKDYQGNTYRFALGEEVFDLMGISNGAPEADLALFAVSHHTAFFHLTPARVHWIRLNFNDAKKVDWAAL